MTRSGGTAAIATNPRALCGAVAHVDGPASRPSRARAPRPCVAAPMSSRVIWTAKSSWKSCGANASCTRSASPAPPVARRPTLLPRAGRGARRRAKPTLFPQPCALVSTGGPAVPRQRRTQRWTRARPAAARRHDQPRASPAQVRAALCKRALCKTGAHSFLRRRRWRAWPHPLPAPPPPPRGTAAPWTLLTFSTHEAIRRTAATVTESLQRTTQLLQVEVERTAQAQRVLGAARPRVGRRRGTSPLPAAAFTSTYSWWPRVGGGNTRPLRVFGSRRQRALRACSQQRARSTPPWAQRSGRARPSSDNSLLGSAPTACWWRWRCWSSCSPCYTSSRVGSCRGPLRHRRRW